MNEVLFCCLGIVTTLAHVLAEMSQAKGSVVWPHQYAVQRPYKVILTIVGAVLGYQVLNDMGELTKLTAFGAGYLATDSIDRIGKMTANKLRK